MSDNDRLILPRAYYNLNLMGANHSLIKTLTHSVFGTVLGIVCGLVFAYAIVLIGTFTAPEAVKGLNGNTPLAGMIAGSIIGTILGGITGLKK